MIGADLNALVNCDIVSHVSPPPDNKLFPSGINTDWLRPGRAVWKYLDGGENTLEEVTWFLAIMNGSTAKTIKIPLAFLGGGKYQATLARDRKDEAAAVTIGNISASRNDSLTIELRDGGGFVGRFGK